MERPLLEEALEAYFKKGVSQMREDDRVYQRKGSSKYYIEYWREGTQFRIPRGGPRGTREDP